MQITKNGRRAGSYIYVAVAATIWSLVRFAVKAVTELLLSRYWGCDEHARIVWLICIITWLSDEPKKPRFPHQSTRTENRWNEIEVGEFHCVSVTQRQWSIQKLVCAVYTHVRCTYEMNEYSYILLRETVLCVPRTSYACVFRRWAEWVARAVRAAVNWKGMFCQTVAWSWGWQVLFKAPKHFFFRL